MNTTSTASANIIAVVRELLLESFTGRELKRFCQEREMLGPLCDRFPDNLALADMVDEVVEYCARQLLFEGLVQEIRNVNPKQYAVFEHRLRAAGLALTGTGGRERKSSDEGSGWRAITVTVSHSPGARVITGGRDVIGGWSGQPPSRAGHEEDDG